MIRALFTAARNDPDGVFGCAALFALLWATPHIIAILGANQ